MKIHWDKNRTDFVITEAIVPEFVLVALAITSIVIAIKLRSS